jgi:hypothetical protein
MTIDRMCGPDDGLLISLWLIEQIHSTVVNEYLQICESFEVAKLISPSIEIPSYLDETFKFAQWVHEAGTQSPDIGDESPSGENTKISKSQIPQIRRSLFFKLLEMCDVRIEPGKGSEIKLLRPGKHPFRLGNHYGPNPTVPAFLAGKILQRLEITHDEWHNALNS